MGHQQQAAKVDMSSNPGIEILGFMEPGFDSILTRRALEFVADLARRFAPRRDELLAARIERQAEIDGGALPDFLPGTAEIRRGDWKIAPVPADLRDRRVEITGPVDRKMIINALNSGAKVFMADFEDSNAPTWSNCVRGQVNLRDAVRRSISFDAPNGKHYELNRSTATLMVRPRGWHLDEHRMLVDSRPVPGALFDFGLFLFHNAHALLQRSTGPYFYLPKLESHREARLWNEVFEYAQDRLDIERGTIKATVLIETILAAFEMDEILYELREHSAGLNCGRWDYIFSFIKKFRNHARFLLPDRAEITMDKGFLRAYSLLLIRTCHARGAHAMGGMAAQIPIKSDPDANRKALDKVRADKLREVRDGHDGTWVAHPGLVPVAGEIFDENMRTPNQIGRIREEVRITRFDLLEVPEGTISEQGLRTNVSVGLRYLESWLRGVGCVPLNHLMEDAATAEISRAQLWQWLRHGAAMKGGRVIDPPLVRNVVEDELEGIERELGEGFPDRRFLDAAALFEEITTAGEFTEFLTLPALQYLD